MAWIFLIGAIATEVCGTLGLRAVADSPRWWAVALITVSYAISFFCMALALRELKVGVVYAIWSAVGTAAVSGAGLFFFGERFTWLAILGMGLIVGGVVVLVSSGSVARV